LTHLGRLLVLTALGALLGPLVVHAAPASDEEHLLNLLNHPGHVLILRHALAPGIGDPDHFTLGECNTQRNLSEEGRADARRLGERLRRAGIDSARIYSSRWCRCLDTAAELGLGPVTPLPVLDSLFREGAAETEMRTRELREFLTGTEPGKPVILVTHQVNIRALVQRSTSSGEGVLLRVDDYGEIGVAGTIRAP
jgi:8-oxo-(d)GTP phosphatase